MPIVLDTDLPAWNPRVHPIAAGTGPFHAGGLSASDWYRQLARWCLPMNVRADEKRLWKVTSARAGEEKIERYLPRCKRKIYIYSEGWHGRFRRSGDRRAFGPYFVLTYDDARCLWQDVGVKIEPWCEGSEEVA